METRPSGAHLLLTEYKLGIFFPADPRSPKLRWIKCEKAFRGNYETPVIDEIELLEITRRDMNLFRDFPYPNKLAICTRDSFLKDGSPLNRCIMALTKNLPEYWSGPVVVMRNSSKEECGTDELFVDARLSELRYAIDFFQTYVTKGENTYGGGTKIRGVRVNCIGDQQERGIYESVAVPKDHPFGPALDLTKLLGIPVRIQKYPHNNKPYEFSPVNQPITKLHRRVHPKLPGWGWAPMEWQNDVGSVLMIRADGKDLNIFTAEVLCALAHSKDGSHMRIGLSIEDEEMEDGGAAEKARQLEGLTKAGFEKFFQEYRQKQIDAGKLEWKNAISPFRKR